MQLFVLSSLMQPLPNLFLLQSVYPALGWRGTMHDKIDLVPTQPEMLCGVSCFVVKVQVEKKYT